MTEKPKKHPELLIQFLQMPWGSPRKKGQRCLGLCGGVAVYVRGACAAVGVGVYMHSYENIFALGCGYVVCAYQLHLPYTLCLMPLVLPPLMLWLL